jgi:ABC-2 type transport system permease protein
MGVIVLAIGILAGGRAFDKRGPEIMAFATSV